MEAQRYQVTQDGKDFILSTNIINNNIRIECKDINFQPSLRYSKDYSLLDLKSFSEIFSLVNSTNQAQNELNNAIERQRVKITNQGDIMEIVFNVEIDEYAQELSFQLPLKQKQTTNYIQTQTTATTIQPQISPQIIINKPVYNNVPMQTYAGSNTQEDDYPDVTYSTKPNTKIYQNFPIEPECGCLLDHDRINKIESNSQILRNENEGLRQRINDLKMKIEMIKKQTKDIRNENGELNIKTLDLKKQYNNLIEAEAALRAENDDLRREKHELILKRNELGFYIKDQHTHDTIREINIPIDGKRKRPTNVSKAEKQFGGGYTSSTNKINSRDVEYNSAFGNNNDYYK